MNPILFNENANIPHAIIIEKIEKIISLVLFGVMSPYPTVTILI